MIGLAAREAVPEVEQQGFIELLDSAFTTGEAFVGKDVKIVLQRSAGSPAETRYVDFVCQPINDAGHITSIFVEGVDITDRHRTEEALRASEARLHQLNLDLERQVLERAQARGLTWKLSPDLLGALNAKARVALAVASVLRASDPRLRAAYAKTAPTELCRGSRGSSTLSMPRVVASAGWASFSKMAPSRL